jgi:hypothetical protein
MPLGALGQLPVGAKGDLAFRCRNSPFQKILKDGKEDGREQ